MSDHIETRRHLLMIYDVEAFERLIDSCMLSSEEKEIILLHYKERKDFRYIGDTLGYSESTIKQKHRKILMKIREKL